MVAATSSSRASTTASPAGFPQSPATWTAPTTGITELPLLGAGVVGGASLLIGAALGAAVGGRSWSQTVGLYGVYLGILVFWWYFAHKRRFSLWRSMGKPVERAHVMPLCLACIALLGVRLGWVSALATWNALPEMGEPSTAHLYARSVSLLGSIPSSRTFCFVGSSFGSSLDG